MRIFSPFEGWLIALVILAAATTVRAQCRDSTCVQHQPGFSCPTAKLFDLEPATGRVVCVDCRGAPPPGDLRTLPCESNKIGAIEEGRNYFCTSNEWRPGLWHLLVNTCQCPRDRTWNGTSCIPSGGPPDDVCLNLDGIQATVPAGYYRDTDSNCWPTPQCLIKGASSAGLMWSTGAEPFWNALMVQLDTSCPAWRDAPTGFDDIRQALDWLGNRWTLGPCDGNLVLFGGVRVQCQMWLEDIVSTPFQPGPFFLINLRMWAQ